MTEFTDISVHTLTDPQTQGVDFLISSQANRQPLGLMVSQLQVRDDRRAVVVGRSIPPGTKSLMTGQGTRIITQEGGDYAVHAIYQWVPVDDAPDLTDAVVGAFLVGAIYQIAEQLLASEPGLEFIALSVGPIVQNADNNYVVGDVVIN